MPTTRSQAKQRTNPIPVALPAEILLLIFAHLRPVKGSWDAVRQSLRDLAAVCRASRQLNRIGTAVLYSCVCLLTRDKAELFLRTARSDRWTAVAMKGRLKEYARELWWADFTSKGQRERTDDVFGDVLGVVDPAKIGVLVGLHIDAGLDVMAPLRSKSSAAVVRPPRAS